ncbi:hypothetical protein GCM10010168_23300 [Actinoplanes ianthinogenes]|uniref:Uncharacterized protein n=1 Tax=Actinoplanes ianthinogenes TaxID=122358 RepID=A0ABM7M8I5_9ACTN|nr:hypothetical protein [Actinoplanes ianthinogenes]BCJ47971.1 hypothetical protein Aiant_86280 [Actinoplanes ianthinogenes]GGR05457.1 hypothetical protein GCM10010168_23300 [Actinoplanes ianthinogenes]
MTEDEIVERIRRARQREQTPARIGGHEVLIDTVRLPTGIVTTVHRILDGRVTVLHAGAGSFREDVARALLDVPAVATGTVQPVAIDVPGLRLDRALALGPDDAGSDPELDERTVIVVAVHHSEILPGEPEQDFATAISTRGTGLAYRLNEWDRHPVPRADARLLDDWPGGMMHRSERFHPWQAERMLTRVAPDGPAEVRVEIRSMAGHDLVLQRRWDRAVGTLTFPDGTPVPIDLPRHELWARLGAVFLGEDTTGLVTVAAGTPEADVLEIRYQTEDRGWASLPRMESLDSCVARLDAHILRSPGNWAVFTSASDAVIQVECTEEGGLWLETPDPDTKQSLGRLVTVAEAATLLGVLAREDRSAVADLPGVETVPWD